MHARPHISQLEDNLVVLDKTTGHMGHQINCLDETRLLQAMGGTADYNRVGRRLSTQELERLQVPVATELPRWRMTLGHFAKAYPETGQVFINDYKEFPNLLHNPALTIYDKVMQFVFDIFLYYHGKSPRPIFPTVDVSLYKRTVVCTVGGAWLAFFLCCSSILLILSSTVVDFAVALLLLLFDRILMIACMPRHGCGALTWAITMWP